MKRMFGRFLMQFSILFLLILLWGKVYQPTNVNFDGIIRAIVIASASTSSWIFAEYIVKRKVLQK
ncbi:hypothetical protein CEN49_25735 [Fischerella thermalis CCMEE 5273]|nr:hypothetical protein CEN49_25735 [Fischerella thermalis CCMEE 5273]